MTVTRRADGLAMPADCAARVGRLGHGASTCIALPDGQPRRRMAYQAVGAIAHRILGPGCYTLRSAAEGVHVTRTGDRDA